MALLCAEISFVIQSLTPPAYSRIMHLDEKVRGLFASPDLDRVKPALVPPSSMSTSDLLSCPLSFISRSFGVHIYLHRAFFLRALTEHPDDPLKSEYSSSVHAALRGAREIFLWTGALLEVNPASCARLHYVWAIALAAAVISMMFISYLRD
jgi:hypothetical protein